jgi:UMP-CMP kinase
MAHCSSQSSKGFCPFSLFLFVGSAIATVRHLRRVPAAAGKKGEAPSPSSAAAPVPPPPHRPARVVFVLGGPGAGKGTQCQLLSEHHGWCHLSAGDLLRAERSKIGSALADVINANISAGRIVPSEITVELIKNAMMEEEESRSRRRIRGGEKEDDGGERAKFLIDGFPRSGGNVDAWNAVVGDDGATVEAVLFFECPEDVLTSRLLERSKTSGRNDDTIDVIRKRFETYREESVPIVEMYEAVGKVRKIVADRSVEEVYREVESILGE